MSSSAGDRGRWRYVIPLLVILCLAMGLLAMWKWSRSTTDLDEIDARAAAMRVPRTWAEHGLRQSEEPVLRPWLKLLQLSKALPSYQSTCGDYSWKGVQPGVAPPTGMLEHHARMPQAALDDVLARCDRLMPGGVDVHAEYTFFSKFDEIDAQRDLTRLLCERLVVAQPDAIAVEAHRAIAVALTQPVRAVLQELVAIGCVTSWQRAVNCRLRDPALPRTELAALADRARTMLESGFPAGLHGDFISARAFIISIQHGDKRLQRGLGPMLGLPGWLDGHGLERPLARYQRGPLLGTMLDAVACWQSAPDAHGRLPAFHALQLRLDAEHAHHGLAGLLTQPALMLYMSWLKADLGLRVLAAELRNESWPIDPTDPAGSTVRRIERDGRLIGYYLLGKNGVDDGGRIKRDDCVSLYEPLGTERASDPLKPDPPSVPPGSPPGAYIYGAQ